MGRPMDAVEVFVYQSLRVVLGTAARVNFSRIEVRHAERIPKHGPLLVAANHPAALTDVLVLGPAIPRRLHFVAYSGLFETWPLGPLLRLAGTVPVHRRQEGEEHMHQNVETFRACDALFHRGGAVLIFPEGTSPPGQRIERLRTGTARMALAYELGAQRNQPLTLLPIGIHYENRAGFRSGVTLSVGRPLELEPLRERAALDPAAAVHDLTARLQEALEKLVLNLSSDEDLSLVRSIEQIYLEDLSRHLPLVPVMALRRGITEAVQFYRVRDRERLHRIWTAVNGYQRKAAALRLVGVEVGLVGAKPRVTELAMVGLVGLLPAVAGAVINFVPHGLTGVLGTALASANPVHVPFSRIITGLVLFLSTYAVYGWLLWRHAHWTPGPIALALVGSFLLWPFAHAYFRWIKREWPPLRVAIFGRSHRRVLARLRAERRDLVRSLDHARDDYLTWLANSREAPDRAAPGPEPPEPGAPDPR